MYTQSSCSCRTADSAALTADTSPLLFVCAPTTGLLWFAYYKAFVVFWKRWTKALGWDGWAHPCLVAFALCHFLPCSLV